MIVTKQADGDQHTEQGSVRRVVADGGNLVSLGLPTGGDERNVGGDSGFEAPEARTQGAGLAGLAGASVDHSARLAAMRAGTLGSIHSWELVTAVDGPGTRMTIFFAGCPLRCLYCHNPDTLAMKNGEPIEAEEILKRIKRYRGVFKASGGGITLSGGEVLMQPRFAATILHGAHELGVHTCIDTSGFLGANCNDEMLKDVDLVLLDVKSGDPETYRRVTGRDLQPTIDFGDRLAAAGTEVWARYVLVPGLTDDIDNVEKAADIVARWPKNVSRVEVLPFHQMGKDKWEDLGMRYELEDTQPPSRELLERVRGQFAQRGFTVY